MEVSVALATNRITELFRDDVALAEPVSTAEAVWIPLIARARNSAGMRVCSPDC